MDKFLEAFRTKTIVLFDDIEENQDESGEYRIFHGYTDDGEYKDDLELINKVLSTDHDTISVYDRLLFNAVISNKVELVKALIENGASVNSSMNGISLLAYALYCLCGDKCYNSYIFSYDYMKLPRDWIPYIYRGIDIDYDNKQNGKDIVNYLMAHEDTIILPSHVMDDQVYDIGAYTIPGECIPYYEYDNDDDYAQYGCTDLYHNSDCSYKPKTLANSESASRYIKKIYREYGHNDKVCFSDGKLYSDNGY